MGDTKDLREQRELLSKYRVNKSLYFIEKESTEVRSQYSMMVIRPLISSKNILDLQLIITKSKM